MTILFVRNISTEDQQKLKANFPEQSFTFCENMEKAKHHIAQAEVLVASSFALNTEIIQEAKLLKWIMITSAGIERVPAKEVLEKGIIVTNARGVHKTPMSEYAISMLLQVYRQEKKLMQNETKGKWEAEPIKEISGKTLLVVGTGSIGQEVARLAKAFRMKTLGISKSGKMVEYFDENYAIKDLDLVLAKADFIVSVLPSTEETKKIFTLKEFKKMQRHAVFLNMGRGDAVESDDLLKAIREGEIAHAVLDVFEQEPLPEDHPFWFEENITVTPHLSGNSPHYNTRILSIFKKNLQTYLEGKDSFINIVDVVRGY